MRVIHGATIKTIGCPYIMIPSKMGKTDNLVKYSLTEGVLQPIFGYSRVYHIVTYHRLVAKLSFQARVARVNDASLVIRQI